MNQACSSFGVEVSGPLEERHRLGGAVLLHQQVAEILVRLGECRRLRNHMPQHRLGFSRRARA